MTKTKFLEGTTCGKDLAELTASFDDSILSHSYGVQANACLKCNMTDNTVKGCKYTASIPSEGKVSFSLDTYTDTRCETGDANIDSTATVAAGECLDGVSFDLVEVEDFRSFVKTGYTYVEYSDAACDTPVAYETLGYVSRQCFGLLKQKVQTCDGSTMQISTYENDDCTGAAHQAFSELDYCFIPVNGYHPHAFADDDAVITERTRMKKYCNELYPAVHVSTSEILSGDAIIAVVIGAVLMTAVLGGLVFYYFKEKSHHDSAKAELHATSERKREQEQASAYRGKSKSVTSINAVKGPAINNPMLNKGVVGPSPLAKKGGLGGKGPTRL
jgi:hypothetical protein